MKKCVMLRARELYITWGDNPQYWRIWDSHPDSRSEEVAELLDVCWLSISGRLKTTKLSPNTTYAAYLIFKFTEGSYGFDRPEQKASVTIGGQHCTKTVCLKRVKTISRSCTQQTEETNRRHGWFEFDIGEFFNLGRNDEEVVMGLFETEVLNWKRGLLVQGIEFRPKN